jgi:hypothetical protein
VSSVLLAPFFILAYAGVFIAPGMLLYPVLIAYSIGARPAGILLGLMLTLGLLALLVRRVARNTRDFKQINGAVSMDHATCMIGCAFWFAVAIMCAVFALDLRANAPQP